MFRLTIIPLALLGFCVAQAQLQADKAFYLNVNKNGWDQTQVYPECIAFTDKGEIMVGATTYWKPQNISEFLCYLKFDGQGNMLNSFYLDKEGSFQPGAIYYDKKTDRFINYVYRFNPNEIRFESVSLGYMYLTGDFNYYALGWDNHYNFQNFETPVVGRLADDVYIRVLFVTDRNKPNTNRLHIKLFRFGEKDASDIYVPEITLSEYSGGYFYRNLFISQNCRFENDHLYLYVHEDNEGGTGSIVEVKGIYDIYLNPARDSLRMDWILTKNRGYQAISPLMIYPEPLMMARKSGDEFTFFAQHQTAFDRIDVWKFKKGVKEPIFWRSGILKNASVRVPRISYIVDLGAKGFGLIGLNTWDKEICYYMVDNNFNYTGHQYIPLPSDFYVDQLNPRMTKLLGVSDVLNGTFKIAVATVDDTRILKVWILPGKV